MTIGARTAGLDAMLAPASIAVVGASSQSTAFSRRALGYLRQFAYPGRVWAVNPSLTDVEGTPCYPSLREIPDAVDLALVFTAAARVEEMMHHAVEAGVKAAAIFSSGFAEMGAAGRALQQRVLDIATPAGIRLLGPNCQGLINARLRMAATFTSAAAGLDQAQPADRKF